MKLNWKTFKVVLAFVVIGGVIFWTANSVRPRSYSGTDLNFDVAGGLNTITNPSDDPVAVQLIGSGVRTFWVSSTIDGVSGSSTRVTTGNTRIHQFEFELPPGTSEFAISSGTDVRFVADTDTELQATVNLMSNEARRNSLIAATVVVLGALFYASNLTGHRWIRGLRQDTSKQDTNKQDTKPTPVVTDGGQGHAARSYGDNRANIGD